MMFKKMNLKNRMLISISLVTFLAFAITIAFVSIKTRDMAISEAKKLAEEMAFRYGAKVQARLEVAIDAARSLAQTFEGIKKSNTTSRSLLDEIQKQILERNKDFIGVWTCWEPNAFDGKDSEYANSKGHDNTGRYVPYWNRGGGKIDVEPLIDYEVEGNGDYYLLSKRSGKETILDPYKYPIGGKEVLITSLVAPIINQGKVLGVAGIDISLTEFEKLIAQIKPFEVGYGYIVSNNGLLVAHHKKQIIGKDFISRQPKDMQQPIANAIKRGKKFSLFNKATGINRYQVLTPITIGKTSTPWTFIISIPTEKVMKEANRIMWLTIIIGTITLLVLMVVVFFIARGISGSIGIISDELNEGTNQVVSAAGEISSSSQQLAKGAADQAASIEETSSSMEEMSSMTKQNAENADHANKLMSEANEIFTNANTSMTELTDSMEAISKASEETSKIVKTIDEIAFQTNLLALNAAVEAARAGEAGAGFAVVADEVRNLAMRAANAAKDTAGLIEGTVKKTQLGFTLVGKTNEDFQLVMKSTDEIGSLITKISTASSEQARGIEQINNAVNQMDSVVQQNAANAEESASASEELNAQADQMKALVNQLTALISAQEQMDLEE